MNLAIAVVLICLTVFHATKADLESVPPDEVEHDIHEQQGEVEEATSSGPPFENPFHRNMMRLQENMVRDQQRMRARLARMRFLIHRFNARIRMRRKKLLHRFWRLRHRHHWKHRKNRHERHLNASSLKYTNAHGEFYETVAGMLITAKGRSDAENEGVIESMSSLRRNMVRAFERHTYRPGTIIPKNPREIRTVRRLLAEVLRRARLRSDNAKFLGEVRLFIFDLLKIEGLIKSKRRPIRKPRPGGLHPPIRTGTNHHLIGKLVPGSRTPGQSSKKSRYIIQTYVHGRRRSGTVSIGRPPRSNVTHNRERVKPTVTTTPVLKVSPVVKPELKSTTEPTLKTPSSGSPRGKLGMNTKNKSQKKATNKSSQKDSKVPGKIQAGADKENKPAGETNSKGPKLGDTRPKNPAGNADVAPGSKYRKTGTGSNSNKKQPGSTTPKRPATENVPKKTELAKGSNRQKQRPSTSKNLTVPKVGSNKNKIPGGSKVTEHRSKKNSRKGSDAKSKTKASIPRISGIDAGSNFKSAGWKGSKPGNTKPNSPTGNVDVTPGSQYKKTTTESNLNTNQPDTTTPKRPGTESGLEDFKQGDDKRKLGRTNKSGKSATEATLSEPSPGARQNKKTPTGEFGKMGSRKHTNKKRKGSGTAKHEKAKPGVTKPKIASGRVQGDSKQATRKHKKPTGKGSKPGTSELDQPAGVEKFRGPKLGSGTHGKLGNTEMAKGSSHEARQHKKHQGKEMPNRSSNPNYKQKDPGTLAKERRPGRKNHGRKEMPAPSSKPNGHTTPSPVGIQGGSKQVTPAGAKESTQHPNLADAQNRKASQPGIKTGSKLGGRRHVTTSAITPGTNKDRKPSLEVAELGSSGNKKSKAGKGASEKQNGKLAKTESPKERHRKKDGKDVIRKLLKLATGKLGRMPPRRTIPSTNFGEQSGLGRHQKHRKPTQNSKHGGRNHKISKLGAGHRKKATAERKGKGSKKAPSNRGRKHGTSVSKVPLTGSEKGSEMPAEKIRKYRNKESKKRPSHSKLPQRSSRIHRKSRPGGRLRKNGVKKQRKPSGAETWKGSKIGMKHHNKNGKKHRKTSDLEPSQGSTPGRHRRKPKVISSSTPKNVGKNHKNKPAGVKIPHGSKLGNSRHRSSGGKKARKSSKVASHREPKSSPGQHRKSRKEESRKGRTSKVDIPHDSKLGGSRRWRKVPKGSKEEGRKHGKKISAQKLRHGKKHKKPFGSKIGDSKGQKTKSKLGSSRKKTPTQNHRPIRKNKKARGRGSGGRGDKIEVFQQTKKKHGKKLSGDRFRKGSKVGKHNSKHGRQPKDGEFWKAPKLGDHKRRKSHGSKLGNHKKFREPSSNRGKRKGSPQKTGKLGKSKYGATKGSDIGRHERQKKGPPTGRRQKAPKHGGKKGSLGRGSKLGNRNKKTKKLGNRRKQGSNRPSFEDSWDESQRGPLGSRRRHNKESSSTGRHQKLPKHDRKKAKASKGKLGRSSKLGHGKQKQLGSRRKNRKQSRKGSELGHRRHNNNGPSTGRVPEGSKDKTKHVGFGSKHGNFKNKGKGSDTGLGTRRKNGDRKYKAKPKDSELGNYRHKNQPASRRQRKLGKLGSKHRKPSAEKLGDGSKLGSFHKKKPRPGQPIDHQRKQQRKTSGRPRKTPNLGDDKRRKHPTRGKVQRIQKHTGKKGRKHRKNQSSLERPTGSKLGASRRIKTTVHDRIRTPKDKGYQSNENVPHGSKLGGYRRKTNPEKHKSQHGNRKPTSAERFRKHGNKPRKEGKSHTSKLGNDRRHRKPSPGKAIAGRKNKKSHVSKIGTQQYTKSKTPRRTHGKKVPKGSSRHRQKPSTKNHKPKVPKLGSSRHKVPGGSKESNLQIPKIPKHGPLDQKKSQQYPKSSPPQRTHQKKVLTGSSRPRQKSPSENHQPKIPKLGSNQPKVPEGSKVNDLQITKIPKHGTKSQKKSHVSKIGTQETPKTTSPRRTHQEKVSTKNPQPKIPKPGSKRHKVPKGSGEREPRHKKSGRKVSKAESRPKYSILTQVHGIDAGSNFKSAGWNDGSEKAKHGKDFWKKEGDVWSKELETEEAERFGWDKAPEVWWKANSKSHDKPFGKDVPKDSRIRTNKPTPKPVVTCLTKDIDLQKLKSSLAKRYKSRVKAGRYLRVRCIPGYAQVSKGKAICLRSGEWRVQTRCVPGGISMG